MRRTFAILSVAMLCGSGAAIAKTHADEGAHAMLAKADGTTVAHATFSAAAGGVRLKLEAAGLQPGVHGIHLHTIGSCTAPDFASAGPHWNPTHKMHGLDSPTGAHMGDLPNLTIGADGKGKIDTLIKGATLTEGTEALLDADGTALVIHAGPDDNKTDPSGNSGGRIACGVLSK